MSVNVLVVLTARTWALDTNSELHDSQLAAKLQTTGELSSLSGFKFRVVLKNTTPLSLSNARSTHVLRLVIHQSA